jgi:trimeric autotransporter adhesin
LKIFTKHVLLAGTLLIIACGKLLAQAPNISYTTPVAVELNVAVGTAPNAAITVTNSGGSVAGTVAYSSTATQPLSGGSFNNSYRGAVDAAGNIYICNFTGNTISKFTSAGALISNTYTSGGTLSGPSGIVFDSSGNMWVLNSNATLLKYNSAGVFQSTTTLTLGGTTKGICIDASNNMYITSYGATDYLIKVTSALVQSTLVTTGNLVDPVEIKISGVNLYVLNRGNGRVTIYNTSGTAVQATHIATVGTTPEGLAVDAINGYLYLTDITNSRIGVYALGTGASIATSATITSVTNCRGLFVDGIGNVYAPNYTGNIVNMYKPTALFFIDRALPTGLTMSKTTGAITGTATVTSTAADYDIAAYNTTGGSSTILNLTVAQYAPTISYANSPAYLKNTVAVGTAPNPSLNVTVSSGVVAGTLAYSSTATQPLTGGSYNNPYRGAVDAAGNIYICNFGNNTISKFTSAGTLISNNYTSGGTLSGPSGIVFDSSGNMWVLNSNATLLKYNSAGVYQSSSTTITVGGTTKGICIDASNNMYITSYGTTDYLIKVTSGLTQSTLVSGGNLNDPVDISISGTNLYILNRAGSNVTIYSTAGAVVRATHIASLGTTPEGIYVDPVNGYTYVTNNTSGTIGVYLLGTTASISVSTSITSVSNCRGLFGDGKGNIYAPNYTGNSVNRYSPTALYFINKTLPTGLSMSKTTGAITGTATTSTFDTYTISAYNATGGGTTSLILNTFTEYTWSGGNSLGVWQTASNWSPATVPGPYDRMLIGLGTYTYEPQIATTESIGSIIMGTNDNSSVIITVNGTLNVAGDIIYQSDAGSLTNNAHIGGFDGSGTVNAANFKMIANTALASTYTLKVNTSVANLNLSGDLSLTSTYPGSIAFNSSFTISAGVVKATDYITSNGANAASISTLAMTGGTLNFTDPTALAGLSANGTNTITLSAGSTIGYTASGAQTVYTNTAVTGLPSGISYQNLSLGGSGIKTASSGNLNITGNFTNTLANDVSNYLDVTGATVVFNGTTQSLAGGSGNGTDFKNTTISGGGTKTISSGKINIADDGILTLSGSSTLAAGGFLTLKSGANSSATVAAIPAGSSITGNVNVERYISGDQSYSRGYRTISSPVSASSGNLVWPNLTYIHANTYTTGTGGATNGFDAVGTGPTMYLYRENMAPNFSSFISGNNRAIAKINNGTIYNFNIDGDAGTFTIPAGNGLLLFFRGDRATTVSPTVTSTIAKPTTFTATGYLNQGDITVKHWTTGTNGLLYTAGSPVSVRGFNLLGNPYASSIDWDLITGQTNIGTTIWVYNPTVKAFSTYVQGNGGVGTNTNGGSVADIIPSGQGFYVKTTGTSPSLTFTESHKVNTQVSAANIQLAAAPPTTDLKYIRVKVTQDAENTDDALIFFKPGTSSDYTVDEDADYLRGNNVVAISTRVNNRAALAINQMPLPTYKENINLNVIVPADGTYQLSVSEIHDMPAQYDVWIKDWLKKDSVNIKTSPTYNFTAVAADSTTFKRRFSIVITTDPGSAYYLTDFKGQKQSGAVQLTWKTGNEGNTTQFTIQRSNNDGLTYADLGSFKSNGSGSYSFTDNSPLFFSENLYRLKHVDNTGNIAYSGTVPIAFGVYGDVVKNSIKPYPNPATSNVKLVVAERRDKNSKAEKYSDYTITISNNQGTAVITINTSQPDSWEGDVSKLAPGVYFINVYNNYTKTLVGNSKFVKL